MSNLRIRTNNVPRDILDSYQLTAKEREEFDYLDWSALDEGTDSASFFRYKGDVIGFDTVMRVEANGELAEQGWHGIVSWSWSNGLLVKYAPDTYCEQIIVGYYYVTS